MLLLGRKPLNLLRDQLPQALRDPNAEILEPRAQLPLSRDFTQHPMGYAVVHHIDQEEGVAVRRLVNPVPEGRWTMMLREAHGQILVDGGLGQTPQWQFR